MIKDTFATCVRQRLSSDFGLADWGHGGTSYLLFSSQMEILPCKFFAVF